MLNRREWILMIAVAGLVGAFALRGLANRLFLRPFDSQRERIDNLTQEITSQQKQLEEALRARAQLAEWEKMSLPPDRRAALAQYQGFLLDLVQTCGFEEESRVVTSRVVSSDKYLTRVEFTIAGRISLEDLTKFFYQFSQPKLLHQVRRADIRRSINEGDSLLIVNLTVEGLLLHSAANRQTLLPDDLETGGPLAGVSQESFALIARRNIFAPYRAPRTDPPPPTNPSIDEASFVRLGSTSDWGEGREAWLYNRLTGQAPWMLRPGATFEIVGIKGKLLSVHELYIVLEIDGRQWALDIGKSLRDVRELAPMQPSPPVGQKPPVAKEEVPASVEKAAAKRPGQESPADDRKEVGGTPSPSETDSSFRVSSTGPGA